MHKDRKWWPKEETIKRLSLKLEKTTKVFLSAVSDFNIFNDFALVLFRTKSLNLARYRFNAAYESHTSGFMA